jgi:hypothetical protein
MTIEVVLLVAGAGLVSAFILQLHRVTNRQLSQILDEVSALRDVVSRVFLMQVTHKTENEPSSSDVTPPPPPADSTVKNDKRENDALQLEMDLEVAEIDELCAKLITLVPPTEATPLLPPERPPSGASERLRPWPQRKNGH